MNGFDGSNMKLEYQIRYFRELWKLHVDNVFVPRSSSHELFITCIAQMFAPTKNVIEYGPFTGSTSFFLVSMASLKGEMSYLVDNASQAVRMDGVDPKRFYGILQASAGLLETNMFSVIDQNVFENPLIEHAAGFVFYDICVEGSQRVGAIQTIMRDMSKKGNPAIICIDDVVEPHDTNDQFLREWHGKYNPDATSFKPFFITGNRLFVSNFEIQPGFIKMMEVLRKFGYISIKQARNQRYGISMWSARQGENKTMKHQNFLMNDQLWNELILASSIGHQ